MNWMENKCMKKMGTGIIVFLNWIGVAVIGSNGENPKYYSYLIKEIM